VNGSGLPGSIFFDRHLVRAEEVKFALSSAHQIYVDRYGEAGIHERKSSVPLAVLERGGSCGGEKNHASPFKHPDVAQKGSG
jgi:hypothetical protein